MLGVIVDAPASITYSKVMSGRLLARVVPAGLEQFRERVQWARAVAQRVVRRVQRDGERDVAVLAEPEGIAAPSPDVLSVTRRRE